MQLANAVVLITGANRVAGLPYGATKSAAWALTNGLRHELRSQRDGMSGALLLTSPATQPILRGTFHYPTRRQ